jgi:hypothetical protein
MKKKLWLVLAVLVLAAALTAYFASPIFAFRSLAEAAETGDEAKLERMVDFPAVREDLKIQLKDRLIGALQQDQALASGPFGQLGALLGPSIVDQVVDVAVTPQGVAAMVRSGRAPLSDMVPTPPPAAVAEPVPAPAPAPDTADDGRETSFAYQGVNRFRATTTTPEAPDAPLGWVLERRGLIAWKLVRIELPPES